MALVAYGASDDEITDSDEEISSNLNGQVETISATADAPGPSRNNDAVSVLAGLPEPKTRVAGDEDELEDFVKRKFIPEDVIKPSKKKHGRVQISVPQLSQADDSDEDEAPVKQARVEKGSSFLSSLPAPKQFSVKEPGRKMIPHTLTKRRAEQPTKAAPAQITPSAGINAAPHMQSSDVESDDEETPTSSFFSLETDSRLKPADVAPPLEPLHKKPPFEPSSLAGPWNNAREPTLLDNQLQPEEEVQDHVTENPTAEEFHAQPVVADNSMGMTEEQLIRLQGRRGRKQESMQILDVRADDGLDPSQITKHMTEEGSYTSHKKSDDLPSGQQKRKHQITYLAFQAKEREQELKNQWASNRLTKQQTQAKYGF